MPIANDLTAEILYGYLVILLDGLIRHNIKVISYACDGTETERSIERLLIANAGRTIEHTILNPRNGSPDTRIIIPVYKGHPIAIIQDSKHALKTYRNNLFSGARLLTFGNYTATYRQVHQVALEDGSPLYRRDVEKLDRQDDSAPQRLNSGDTLEFIAKKHPEFLFLIIFLFVFGELIDAYQNRFIPHIERVKLALRARYFLDQWGRFLDNSGYPRAKYFLSREAVDITRIIIEGLLSLVYIHRDHISDVFPLLPWLHSSEACEHVFAEARKIVKDFAMLDFFYMIPKLRVQLREAVLSARTSDPKARANGYDHTYFDCKGMDILALSVFPTDDEIKHAAIQAADEVDSLVALLGVVPSQLHHLTGTVPSSHTPLPVLPSISAWFNDETRDIHSDDEDTEDLSDDTDAQELQAVLKQSEDIFLPYQADQELINLRFAAIAISTDDIMRVYVVFCACTSRTLTAYTIP